jgi:hypothetical protein
MKSGLFTVLRAVATSSAMLIFLGAYEVPAQIIYSNGFEGSVGTEWSQTTTSVTPVGARAFLGEFGLGNQTVSLIYCSH